MAVIGTFGSFTAARLGIYASQASLNVTGNNISNINTKGYTRQRMDLVSLHSAGSARYANSYNLDIGYGVIADSVSQLRTPSWISATGMSSPSWARPRPGWTA